jgi:hypothetical protein
MTFFYTLSRIEITIMFDIDIGLGPQGIVDHGVHVGQCYGWVLLNNRFDCTASWNAATTVPSIVCKRATQSVGDNGVPCCPGPIDGSGVARGPLPYFLILPKVVLGVERPDVSKRLVLDCCHRWPKFLNVGPSAFYGNRMR